MREITRVRGKSMNEIAFICCANDEMWFKECETYIRNLEIPDGYKIRVIPIFGAESMAQGYNEGRLMSAAKYKIYIHQDVFIVHKDFISDILDIFECDSEIGIIGIVGANEIRNDKVTWGEWEYGKVLGCNGTKEIALDFGTVNSKYERVDCVDGMLIATQYDIPWREDIFTGWDFYDRSICIEYLRTGYKTVVPRQEKNWCIHDCAGSNLGGWKEDLLKFFEEYKEYFSAQSFAKSYADVTDIEESNRVEDIANGLETLINCGALKEAIEIWNEICNAGIHLNKKLIFNFVLLKMAQCQKHEMFFRKGDTVDNMLWKYTKAKFVLRREVYGMEVSEEELGFIERLSEEEKKIIIEYNLLASMAEA